MSGSPAGFVAVLRIVSGARLSVASGAISIEHDDRGETQDSVFCLSRVVVLSAPQPRVRTSANWVGEITWSQEDRRVGSGPWEVGFVARFGMTSCSPTIFNMRLGEHDNMKPINELLQAMKVRKSVDQHTDSGS